MRSLQQEYVKSDPCGKELREFIQAAAQNGGVFINCISWYISWIPGLTLLARNDWRLSSKFKLTDSEPRAAQDEEEICGFVSAGAEGTGSSLRVISRSG